MKAICPISGFTYQIGDSSHFRHTSSIPAIHPLLTLSYSQLAPIIRQWQFARLGEIETKLLTISVFNCTKLVQWDSPCNFQQFSIGQATKCLPALIEFINWLSPNDRQTKWLYKYFVQIRISHETSTTSLALLDSYISTWNDNIAEYFTAAKSAKELESKRLQDAVLERMLFKATGKPGRYIKYLAKWARIACNFPTHNIPVTLSGKFTTCADYWEYCIVAMGNRDIDNRIYNISIGDILDLQDWVLNHLTLDNDYAFTLARLINQTLEDITFFTKGNFNIVENVAAQETFLTNHQIISNEPQRKDYLNNLDYIKALALYNTQQTALAGLKELASLRVNNIEDK